MIVSLPVNLECVASDAGFSKAYFHSAPGVAPFSSYAAQDFGGIIWNGLHYRAMGDNLVTVAQDGSVSVVGSIGTAAPTRFDYSFTQLMINRGTSLYLYDGTTITQITDVDLGDSLDALWMDGYFISTDGRSIVVTQLADPFSVDPLKYGSAEADPDSVVGLLKLRAQLVVLGGYTIQFFSNEGGGGFPFRASTNATISTGCIGRDAKALYDNGFAWVGARRNQKPSVWYSEGGDPVKLSTREVDDIIAADPAQSQIQIEERTDHNERRLYVHLSDRSLVYLKTASEGLGSRIWYAAYSNRTLTARYRPRFPVLAYGKWIVGDADGNGLGVIDETTATVFGNVVGWRFDTPFSYNEAKGGIAHRLELTGMPGRGGPSTVFMSWTLDGETWSEERATKSIPAGGRGARVSWRPHKRFGNYIGLRFRGDSQAIASWARLDADVEGLAV